MTRRGRIRGPRDRLDTRVWVVAGAVMALELAVSARYGFHRDELYFVVAGRHPAFGYVDQPPLAPLLTRLETAVLGVSPSAVRLLPALAGAAVVVGSGVVARLLGGRGLAQFLAAVAMGCAPVLLASAHLAGTTAYDLLAWTVATAAVIAAVRGRSRAWVVAGLAVGLGLENKDLLLLLVASVGLGIVVCGPRRVLADRWLWVGAVLAIALWAPNLIWESVHGWPGLIMARSLQSEHSTGSDYTTVLPAQVLYLGVAALPVAVAGFRRLWVERSTRFLAVAAVALLAYVVADIPGRPYYDDGLLPLLFASGGVAIERCRRGPWVHRAAAAAPVLGALVALPLVLPVLPEATWSGNAAIHKVNYDMTETIGWPQLTAKVAAIVGRLPAGQREQSSIFTANYGEAGALIVLGTKDHLPPVLSGHNTFWLWGPGDAPDGTVIAIGAVDQLRSHFAACREAATFQSPNGVVDDENGVQIWLCTHPAGPWRAFWAQLRHYD